MQLTQAVIAACQRAGVARLLQMSSLNAGVGDSHYLRTRGIADAAVMASGLQVTVFRPSVIFGAGDGLVLPLCRLAATHADHASGRATTRFQPVHVDNVAAAITASLTRADSVGATFELGGPRS